MGILHQKYSRGPYSCSAYYTTQSCCFLLQFTTRNVVTLALPLTRTRCVCFMTDTFNCKDLHIHLMFIIFFLFIFTSYGFSSRTKCSKLILSDFDHSRAQRSVTTTMADILFSSPGILLVSQNSFPDPKTHTDPGSLSTKTVKSTRVGKKEL